jgi:beta-lactamase class A
MGVSIHNLQTGERVEVNGDAEFRTASTIKVAVMGTVFEELTSPTGMFRSYYDTRKYDPATSTGGAGFVRNFVPGTPVELKELLHFMITVSDNTATNMLVDWLGGAPRVNRWLEDRGLSRTRLLAMVGGRIKYDPALNGKWGLGVTTPNEMRRLLEMIHAGRAVASTTATEEMLRILGHQYFDDLIAGETPPAVWVGSKSGAVNDSRSDNAIVASPGGTYVISVYTDRNEDRRWTKENEGEASIRKVARETWRHFNPDSRWQRPAGAGDL